jgi:hypothetical protein
MERLGLGSSKRGQRIRWMKITGDETVKRELAEEKYIGKECKRL